MSHRTTARVKAQALLSGLLFDDVGQPMISTHATKNLVRYRYYVSAPCLRGPSDRPVGSVRRVPAQDIELAIQRALVAVADPCIGGDSFEQKTISRETLEAVVSRIEVQKHQLAVHLKTEADQHVWFAKVDAPDPLSGQRVFHIPWEKPSIARTVLRKAEACVGRVRSIRPKQRLSLIRSIGLGRWWLRQIVDGSATAATLAEEHDCTLRQINLTISLAFLAP